MIYKTEKKNLEKKIKYFFEKEFQKNIFQRKFFKKRIIIFQNENENNFSKKIFFIFHFSFFIFFISCSKEKIFFEKNYAIPQHQWLYKDSLSFSFDVPDTFAVYDVQITVKHDNSYPFQNLYTNISTTFPNQMRVPQILNLDLFDNTGNRLGKTSGNETVYKTNIKENAFFNAIGKHTITLEQFTRQDTLPGIESIGITLIQKEEKRK